MAGHVLKEALSFGGALLDEWECVPVKIQRRRLMEEIDRPDLVLLDEGHV